MKKLVIMLLALTLSAFATNGMNTIGNGTQSASLGGTTFLTNNASVLGLNPAIMGFADRSDLSLNVGLMFPKVHFTNSLNDLDADDQIFPLPEFSYMHKLDGDINFGVSFFAQGGMGATYEMDHNLYRDYQDQANGMPLVPQKYHSKIAYMKLTPAISYNVNNKFSIGLAPSLGYAMLEMKMPYSMSPSAMTGEIPEAALQPGFPVGSTFGDMFGAPASMGGLGYSEVTATADMEDGVTAMGFGGTIGFGYEINEQFSMGLSYTMQSDLTFEGDAGMDMTEQFGDAYGRMMQNTLAYMGANGMLVDPQNPTQAEMGQAMDMVNGSLGAMEIDMAAGMVAEYKTEVEMAWPQMIDFSISYAPVKTTTIFADVKWVNWAAAMEDFKMTMTEGSNDNINKMMGGEEVVMVMPLDWEDQIVIALGVQHQFNEMFSARVGYNYGSNPVPAETLMPLFPAVVEQHITAGVGIAPTKDLAFDLGFEFVPEVEGEVETSLLATEYNGSKSSLSEMLFHFGVNYKF